MQNLLEPSVVAESVSTMITQVVATVAEAPEIIIKTALSFAWSLAKDTWPIIWPYFTAFTIWIVGGVIWQIIMVRNDGPNGKLSSSFNRTVGSVTYYTFFGLLFFMGYKVVGADIFDDLWFLVIGAIAYPAVKLFLRGIGFWYR